MASRIGALDVKGADAFAIGVWARAVMIGALAFGVFIACSHQFYATALIFAAVAGLIGIDLSRSAGAADRLLAQFVDSLIAQGDDRPREAPGVGRMAAAIERALDQLAEARAESQRRADFTAALADNVLAALLVVDEAGLVVLANRSARQLLGALDGPLGRIARLSEDSHRILSDLPPGGRAIIRLVDNRALLASISGFSTSNSGPLRLISLQTLSGDLDAVVLKSWQDLARVLAHEMMNSLTPICSLSDSIAARLRTGESDDLAEAAAVIARRGAGLMSFVERYRQLCDLPPAVHETIVAAPFLGRLDRLMAPIMSEAGVDYRSALAPRDARFEADPDLLEQAIINLLKNAVDATAGRDDRRIRLVCAVDGLQAVISIEDNGAGLANDDPEAAFTPFFTTKPDGSGIGLTLARQIALAHGGRLDYARGGLGGARFSILLPCAGQRAVSGER